MKDFYSTLRKIRIAKGLSQENLGDSLGITGSAYAQMERGESKVTVERLYELSQIFNMSVEEILSYDDEKNQSLTESDIVYNTRDKGYEISITIKITDPAKEGEILELIKNLK